MDFTAGPTFAALIEAVPDGMLVVDPSGVIQVCNQQACRLFGAGPSGLVGTSVDDLLPEAVRDRHREHRRRYLDAPDTRPMGIGMLLEAERKDGTAFPVEISLSPVQLDGVEVVIAAVRDVSARVEGEREAAIASDRARIARDLHDTVIQRLFASGLALEAIVADDGSERLHEVVADLDATIAEIRDTIFDLENLESPAHSVRGRIDDVIHRITRSSGLEVRTTFQGPLETLDATVLAELLPSLREALSNVVRHADATVVWVELAAGPEVVLVVRDDGVGTPETTTGTGHGIRNLGTRAVSLGGTCTVRSVDPNGTEVVWSVPG